MKKLVKKVNLHIETVEAYDMPTFANGSCICLCKCYGNYNALMDIDNHNTITFCYQYRN